MSLFSKLKSRLMKTSSKLDEGLEAIVEDGGEESSVSEALVEEVVPTTEAPDTETPEAPEPEVTPEPMPEPEPIPAPEPTPAPEPAAPEPDPVPADVPQEMPPTPAPLETPVEAPVEMPAEAPVEIPVEKVVEAPAETVKPGFLGRLLGRKESKTVTRRALDDDMLEQLEELLISADMGVETSMRVTAAMAEGRYGKKLSVEEIKRLMAQEVARIMEPVAKPMPLYTKTPQVVLVVGVNGSGKTTTIGKLASQFKAAGKSVVIAAGDTFRAAAVEQLQVWGERAGVPVLTAPEGSDPASLAFDAMTKAQETGADLLMIDTAGRLQNRADLMEELAKIVRVIRKKDPTAPHNTLLVLDATTGQNAVSQVEIFRNIADVSGLVMTKLDGTAKGGVLVSLADKFGLPIHAIGVGEQIDDLAPFDPEEFAAALTGLEV
jgi:fused signal recognition particle receptor